MLFTSHRRSLAGVAVSLILCLASAAFAESGAQPVQNGAQVVERPLNQVGQSVAGKTEKRLLVQASCPSCGAAVLDPLALLATNSKIKDQSLMTDSLWGNLILEMAYQRDKELQKLAKRMNIMSLGTLGAIGLIAGGTLAQGIDALYVLNPQPGHEDSYSPGIVGVTMSSATLLTFFSRIYFNHRFQGQVRRRQIAIKTEVESILDHLEHSDGRCASAQKELTELIGDRACREWVQLWQSSHQIAMIKQPRISSLNRILETR